MKYTIFSILWLFPILLFGQSIFDLQHQSVILAPLRDSSYTQSIYTPKVANKWNFKKEYRINTDIYGKPIYIDSVYTIFPKSKKKNAIIIDININKQQILYHLPLYFDRTKEKLSFMWHYQNTNYALLHRASMFDKNSFYSKNFGTIEQIKSTDIFLRYYNYDTIQCIKSLYKDSVITIVLTTNNLSLTKQNKLRRLILDAHSFEFIFKGLSFKKDDEIEFYKNEGVYPLCIALQSTKTSQIFYLPIATTDNEECPNLNDVLHIIKRKYDSIKQLSINSENFKPIINSIGQPIYIKNPNLWNRYSIKWWYNPININQYSNNALESEPISWDSFIDCVLCDITILPNIINPTPWDLGKGRMSNTLGVYQYYAKILPHPSRKEYNKVKNDTLLIPIDYQSVSQLWNTNQIDSLINIRDHEIDMANRALKMSEEFNLAYASSQWDANTIDKIIYKRQVKFGYTTEMCLIAYRGQEYKVSFVTLPIGRAKRYHFLGNDFSLYFIEDKLIGIQFPMNDDIIYE